MKRTVAVLIALTALLAACGGDDGADVRDGGGSGSGSGPGSGSGSAIAETGGCNVEGGIETDDYAEVAVSLDEYSISLDTDTAEAGAVEFVAENAGEEPHELVVVKGTEDDLVVEDGVVDEEALPEGAFVGEIEAFAAGETCEGIFELEAGDYVLFCTLVEGDHAHFEEGMVTSFTVS